ncbi:hypothetical protein AA313_de0210458 [Arthrobotrys entomopaga]|nr:hypothetical protein AA313_de0210458 [Arthrobotrys entomopaga]
MTLPTTCDMATFENLAVELKLLILKNIPDSDSLNALRLASRVYKQVYDNFRNESLDEDIWMNEVQPYKADAYFLAAYKDKLGFTTEDLELQEVIELVRDYVSQYKAGRAVAAEDFFGHEGITPQITKDLIKTHKAIRGICNFFISEELSSKQPESEEAAKNCIPATTLERERITKALYRLWLIYLICLEREEHFKIYCVSSHHMDEIFDQWDAWDFMTVIAVNNFCWKQLAPIMRRYIKALTADSTYDFTDAGPLMFSAFMTSIFPNDLLSWFKYSGDKSINLVAKIQNLFSIIGPLATRPAYTSRLFTAFLNDPPSSGFSHRIQPIRICKPEHTHFGAHEQYGDKCWIKPFPWRNMDHIDFKVCMWDDWRLERWGYVFPVFEEGGDSRPEDCLDPYDPTWVDLVDENLEYSQ